jgi:hypothetical protein
MPDVSGMVSKFRWAGPAIAAAGAFMLSRGNPSTMMKIGGWSMLASGIGTTIMGFSANGGIKKEQELLPQVQGVVMENQQLKAQLQQIIAEIQQQGGIPQSPTTPTPPSDPTTPTTPTPPTDPTSPTTPTSPTPPTSPTTQGTPTAPTTPGQGAEAPVIPAASWDAAALIGSGVDVTAGQGPGGAVVADAGRAVLKTLLGNPEGYTSFVEADQAARDAVNTGVFNTKAYRWMVIEHAGKYYAYEAMADETTAAAATLPAANGTLVSWHGLRMIQNGANYQWFRYDWSAQGASVATQL